MPIGKVICSSSFTATSQYVLEKEKARLLGGTMLGQSSNEIIWEFEQSKRLNPKINRPCLHLILSYSTADERLNSLEDNLLAEISEEHFAGCAVLSRWHKPLQELDKNEYRRQVEEFKQHELNHYQFFSAVHEDVHHRHTHLVGSRINTLDGKCLETWQNRIKSQYVIRDIEQRYGLEMNQSSWQKDRRGLSRRQIEKWQQTGIKPLQLVLQEKLDQAITQSKNLEELSEVLQKAGVDMQLHQPQSGQIYGITYAQNGIAFQASRLGKKYTIKGLEQAFKEFDSHEQPTLRRDINQGAGGKTDADRAALINQYSVTPEAITGLRKLCEQRRTQQITTVIRKLESTIDHIESSLRSQQQLTKAITDRIREVERQQALKKQKRQKQSNKGIER